MAAAWVLVFVFVVSNAVTGYKYGGYHHRGSHGTKSPGDTHNHYYHEHVHNHFGDPEKDDHKPLGRHREPQEKDDDAHAKRYHFQVGGDLGPYEYFAKDGTLQGWNIDLLLAVCHQAKKRCQYLVDDHSHCWNTRGDVETPGRGLLDHWYVGCLGLLPTVRRLNSFNFTVPYTKNTKAGLHHLAGETLATPTDLKNKTIGFVSGWASSKDCLAHQGSFQHNKPEQYKAVSFEDHFALVEALKSKKVDLILTMEDAVKGDKKIAAIEPLFYCSKSGLAVMTRYGSHLLCWWNKAFEEFRHNGGYAKLCAEGNRKHGFRGHINCL